MKKVLIALDYNLTAQKVAETGFAMAKALGAEIALLHVIADPVYYSSVEYSPITGFSGIMDLSSFQTDDSEELKKAAVHYLDNFKQLLNDKSIQILIGEGDYAQSILKTASDIEADIIVMGSHSHKWIESVLMGSVTEKVFHHTTKPLFIVPTKKHQ